MREGPLLHFFSSLVAGVSAATANNPVDVVKSRMQAETLQSGVQPSHRNIPQVWGTGLCVYVITFCWNTFTILLIVLYLNLSRRF